MAAVQSSMPSCPAIDGSGDVWFASGFANNNPNYLIAELIGAASPVVTPLAAGVKTNMLGTRP
jgi:hypothetical protein